MVRATERRRSTTKPEQSNQKMPLPRQFFFFQRFFQVLLSSLEFFKLLFVSILLNFRGWGNQKEGEGGGVRWSEVRSSFACFDHTLFFVSQYDVYKYVRDIIIPLPISVHREFMRTESKLQLVHHPPIYPTTNSSQTMKSIGFFSFKKKNYYYYYFF